jgi:PIN domain nuclease of toxin-antitoxin system
LRIQNQIWLSTVSLWEIAIKHSLRKGDMPIADLPNHHQDPFDRLLVAQAITEPMRLMTHDANIIKYGDIVIGV